MTKQLKIGLTGSIGMGKSTTLKMFKKRKILTWCADEAIARLYSCYGAAIEQIKKISPKSVINNCVSKENLRMDVQARPHILTKIEGLVNPLIRKDRQLFLKSNVYVQPAAVSRMGNLPSMPIALLSPALQELLVACP